MAGGATPQSISAHARRRALTCSCRRRPARTPLFSRRRGARGSCRPAFLLSLRRQDPEKGGHRTFDPDRRAAFKTLATSRSSPWRCYPGWAKNRAFSWSESSARSKHLSKFCLTKVSFTHFCPRRLINLLQGECIRILSDSLPLALRRPSYDGPSPPSDVSHLWNLLLPCTTVLGH